MNPRTGELLAVPQSEDAPAGFDLLPAQLEAQARMKIRRADFYRKMAAADRDAAEAMQRPDATARVNLRSGSPLARWAREKRREKTAAASRRRNRPRK